MTERERECERARARERGRDSEVARKPETVCVREKEKREAEAQARRDQIAQQELIITIVGIVVLLIFTFVGAAAYLHYMEWIDVRDYFR